MNEFFSEANKSIAAEFISANLDMGIYPKSIQGENGYKERTEYMSGWNEAVIRITKAVEDGLKKFHNSNEDLAILVLSDVGFFNGDKYYLNMNDTFYYACADAEEVTTEEYGEVARLFKRYGYDGLIYWVAKKRNIKSEIPHKQADIERVAVIEEKRNKKG